MVTSRLLRWAGASLVFLCLIVGFYFAVARRAPVQRTVRVGVDHSPPFYSIHSDGSVTGLAVDVFNEAARRRGITVVWTPLHDFPLDNALNLRKVEMWPLVGTTPERAKRFYLSEPWLESDYVLVSLKENAVRNVPAAAGKTIAHARLKLTTILAHRYLSASTLAVRLYRADAISAVCAGEASAAFMESRALDALLLERPAGCEKANFNISSLPGVTSPLSIAAVPEARGTAMAMRAEIDTLIADGFLSRKLDEWSPFSAEGTRSIWAQRAANERSVGYRYAMAAVFFFSFILAWLAYRAWRLRQIAERAETGLREAQRRFSAFMENSPAIAFMKDAAGRILYVNRTWSRAFGMSPEQVYGKTDQSLWPAVFASTLRDNDLALIDGDKPRQVIETVPVANGESRDWLVVKFPFESESGERFVGGTAIDITERQQTIRELADSEARYRELFEHNPLPAWVYDRTTHAFLAVNEAAIRLYGWTRADFLSGLTLDDIVASPGRPHGHVTEYGKLLTVDVTSYELDYEQRPACLMIVRDLSEQERTLEQLRLSEERWQLALSGGGDVLWDWDLMTNRVFRSPRWRSLLGYDDLDLGDSHQDFLTLVHPDDRDTLAQALAMHFGTKEAVFSVEYRLRHKDGSWRWILDRGQAVWDSRGDAVRMAGSQTDITDRKRIEDLLAQQARTDALTGLVNRREFERLFAEQIRSARTGNLDLTVCVCDLDCFKNVNDSFGHSSGDRVLTTFAEILRRNLRKTDVLARMGGDEFVLALPGTTVAETRHLVERVREQLHSTVFRSADGTGFHVSSSFGVAGLSAAHRDGDQLLEDADRFLYDAKSSGRNRTLAVA